MTETAARVSRKDALAVLKAILTTFSPYVCDGHQSTAGAAMGSTVYCDGTCAYPTARKTREAKSYIEMDATPTLCDHEHEQLPVGCWSIFWEGNSPTDWVFSDTLRSNVETATDGRVFIEPINGCILGVFAA